MVNCGFCTGTRDIKTADDLEIHIRAAHLYVPGDTIATNRNIDRLVKEVAKCWQEHTKQKSY